MTGPLIPLISTGDLATRRKAEQRLLNHIVPDYVHILAGGKIRRTGGKELALEVEESGYVGIDDAA
jgi:Fe-S cluster assembly ATPase SufC